MFSAGVVSVFFFKQKTAYEMRISDWSSDVCSSDLAESRIRRQHRVEQCLGVGMARLREEPLAFRLLHNPAGIHHRNARRHVFDDSQIVADQEVGEIELTLQVAQQVEDLRLHRYVEG